MSVPKPEQPKVPIDAIKPPNEAVTRPRGRASLISTDPALRRKPAYTLKSSLLG